ncbi:MAG TPA: glycosyltransferase family 4 protein [Solirubrobacterales bacterium]|nr:glycosyltransferase family 4 protein [Solirubrobacterales bacterium]
MAQLGPDPDGPGGIPAVVRALLRSPLAERYRFETIPTHRDRNPVRRLVLFGRSLIALARWCAGPGPRIAHVHMAARGSMYRKALVVAVVKAMRRPVILHVHAGSGDIDAFLDRLGPLRRRILRAAFAAADRVLSVSASSAGTLRARLIDAEIVVVPNAPPEVVPNVLRPRREEVEILFLGGFDNPVKGGAVLLDALPSLLRRCPRTRVLLAGPGQGPATLPDGVRWGGWLDEAAKDEAFRAADLFAMPSLSEGLPVALLEAMARGLPIVVSRIGGVPEVVTDGVDAVLVEPGDAAELAARLGDLVDDPDRRRELGEAAIERARRLADDDVYGRLDRIYAELTS